jgi:hypothetical protein
MNQSQNRSDSGGNGSRTKNDLGKVLARLPDRRRLDGWSGSRWGRSLAGTHVLANGERCSDGSASGRSEAQAAAPDLVFVVEISLVGMGVRLRRRLSAEGQDT